MCDYVILLHTVFNGIKQNWSNTDGMRNIFSPLYHLSKLFRWGNLKVRYINASAGLRIWTPNMELLLCVLGNVPSALHMPFYLILTMTVWNKYYCITILEKYRIRSGKLSQVTGKKEQRKFLSIDYRALEEFMLLIRLKKQSGRWSQMTVRHNIELY